MTSDFSQTKRGNPEKSAKPEPVFAVAISFTSNESAHMPSKRKPGRPRLRRPKTDSPTWYGRLLLSPDDALRRSSILTTGNLSHVMLSITTWSPRKDKWLAQVVYTESTLKLPFRTSHHLVQKDMNDAVLVEATW